MLKEIEAGLMPNFAPMGAPIVQYLWKQYARVHKGDEHALMQQFYQKFVAARIATYALMDLVVRGIQDEKYSTSWVLKTLATVSPGGHSVSLETASDWHRRNLLHYFDYGTPDYDTAAALLIARKIDTRKRNWLPHRLEYNESYWVGFRQDAPVSGQTQPILSCPFPHEELPKATLLWTPWRGASWRVPWMLLDNEHMGSVRFGASVRKPNGTARWDVTLDDLRAWDNETVEFFAKKDPDLERKPDKMQLLADVVLYHLGEERLSAPV